MNQQAPTPAESRSESHAEVATLHASKYLQQLCKHFAHKLPVRFDEHVGHATFPAGECHLEAGDNALRLSLTSPDATQLAQLQDVVARHLVRFAFREELIIDWQTPCDWQTP